MLLRRSLLFLAAVLATAKAQAPAYIFGTTSQALDAPTPFLDLIPGDVDAPNDVDTFVPQFYAASIAASSSSARSPFDDSEGATQREPTVVDPTFYSPTVQAKLYASSGAGTPLKDAIAPPAFVAGQVPLAVSPILSQYQNQYVDGRYEFAYAGGPNSRTEIRDASGAVRGAYIYVDAFGNVQSRRYVADDQGFRAQGTDIPKATFVLDDTPEVQQAKEALKEAYEQARTRTKRSSQPWLYYRVR